MIRQDVNVGDIVQYHGSNPKYYGVYKVISVPEDKEGRGYVLAREDDTYYYGWIRNVHRDSITLKVAMNSE